MTQEKPWRDFFDGHAPDDDENRFTKATEAEVTFLIEESRLMPGAASVGDAAPGGVTSSC